MGLVLAYSIKSAIILTMLFAIYFLTSKPQKGASMRRLIYISTALLPFLETSMFHPHGKPEVIATPLVPAILSSSGDSTVYRIFTSVVIGGILLLFLHMALTFAHYIYLRAKGHNTIIEGLAVTVLEGKQFSPFCFGRRMFVSSSEIDSISAMVVCHEKSHIKHHHFLDLVFARLLTILQWWNPCSWIMLRELQDVHEFQADEDVIKSGYSLRKYQYMLLKRVTGTPRIIPSHGIRHSRLQQRLRMMNKVSQTNQSFFWALFLVPGVIIALIIIKSPVLSPLLQSLSDVDVLKTYVVFTDEHKNPGPSQQHKDAEIFIDGVKTSRESLNDISPEDIQSIDVYKETTEHPYGLIKVELKNESHSSTSVNDKSNNSPNLDNVKVVSMGTIKKS